MSIWKPALFFVFCLFIALIINLPVGYLMAYAKVPDQVKISQLSGTLFEGQVETLIVNQVVIEDLEYEFNSSCLITLELCYQFNFTDSKGQIRYAPVAGSVELAQLDIELSMSNLTGMSDQLLIQPSGSLYLSSDKVKYSKGQLADIDAVLVWKNAGIVGEDIDLGDYQLSISKQNQQYQIVLSDLQAMLKVDGKGELKSNGSYSMSINIDTKTRLDPNIKNVLELVATKKGLRQYSVRRSGTTDKRILSYLSFEGA